MAHELTARMYSSSVLNLDLLRFDLKVWVVVLAHARMIGSPPNSMQQAFWAKYHAKLIANLDPVARERKRKNSADPDTPGTAREAISLRQFAKERTRMH